MISLIEVLDYRCLRYVRQNLGTFHVLVGPNASGKTTFLDVVSFLSRLVSHGLDAAIDDRPICGMARCCRERSTCEAGPRIRVRSVL